MILRARRKQQVDELFTNGHPYTALEAGPDFSFQWPPAQVRKVIQMWEAGIPIDTMAKRLSRDPDEVAVLIIDLARREIIGNRIGGVWGEKEEGAA